ncbi:MAG: hypothetical protein KAJ14_06935 [Candidatus Omnitrophica bacterium]|nr:hypothetical protein [Candidatus Omnitrophota bacterium]MCK5592201.1 hypothetical protein [Candidatus Paceibacterota bacterium]
MSNKQGNFKPISVSSANSQHSCSNVKKEIATAVNRVIKLEKSNAKIVKTIRKKS